MSELFDSTLLAISNGMDIRSRRQTILATNMANIDTPNYVPKDLDFEAALRKATAVRDDNEVTVSDPRHIGGGSDAMATAEVITRPDRTPGRDGNAVDLDRQIAQAALNSGSYSAMARAAQKKLSLLKYVIQQ